MIRFVCCCCGLKLVWTLAVDDFAMFHFSYSFFYYLPLYLLFLSFFLSSAKLSLQSTSICVLTNVFYVLVLCTLNSHFHDLECH